MVGTNAPKKKNQIVLFGQYVVDRKKETNSASGAPQLTRGKTSEPGAGKHSSKWDDCVKDVKKKGSADNAYAVCTTSVGQSAKKESKKQKQSKKEERKNGPLNFTGRFKEVLAAQDGQTPGKRFRVTLLQEGLGNFHDAFYYTKSAIQSAAALYEGEKSYIDHPSESEEVDRPERSVKDILGYFENVSVQQTEGGASALMGDLNILQAPSLDQYRSLMLESLDYSRKHPDQDLVGLSINASGDFDTVAIEQFLKSEDVPDACKPKLLEAVERGVTMVRPVREMKSAVSCDLVTTAGAGGKINQLLEGKQGKMKKENEKESKKKEADMEDGMEDKSGGAGPQMGDHAAGSADGSSDPADGQSGDAPDAQGDADLIMKLLKNHLGDGFSDDDKQMMGEAYQNALEMGMEGKEAEDCAGHNMKMAKHLQAKQAKMSQDGMAQEGGDKEGVDVKAKPVGDAGSMPKKDQVESGKGGQMSLVAKLTGQVAALTQKLEAIDLEKAIDKGLRESKLPMSATKKFRESCLTGVKTIKDFNEKLAVFKEAFSLGGEAQPGFVYGAEKTSGDVSDTGFSAADCVEK